MSKELMLFCNADGKWAVYDDTFDITIHCESQQEQDEAMAMLRKANSSAGEVMSPENMAHALVSYCLSHNNNCEGCVFDKLVRSHDGEDVCPIEVPMNWNLEEECSEAAKAALKLRRARDGVNPTPVSEEEAFSNLVEELADIYLCSIVLFGGELGDDDPCNMCDDVGDNMVEIMEQKLARWKYRLKKKEESNVPEE